MLGNKGTRKHYRTGGARGGQDQFRWEDVKGDKDRENYLGHSQMAPIGRWQNGKDLFWYAKKQGHEAAIMSAEISDFKSRDDDLINSALGLQKKPKDFCNQALEKDELKQLFLRGETDRSSMDIERIEGLGAAPSKLHDHIQRGLNDVEKEISMLRGELNSVVPSTSTSRHDIRVLKRYREDDKNREENKSSGKHKRENKESKSSKKSNVEKKDRKEKKEKRRHRSDS